VTRYSETDAAAVAGTEKAVRAWEARKHGATLDQAAKVAGYANRGAAHNAITTLKKGARDGATAEMVAMEEERLDYYLLALDPQIKTGDTKAITAALKIGERRAKLLGLDDFERRMAEVNERKVALQEMEAVMVATVLANVIRKLELSPDKVQLARQLIAGELRAAGAPTQVIPGELADA
jgi:hypothetical protein